MDQNQLKDCWLLIKNNGKYKNWRNPKVEIFEFCFDPSILLIFLMKKHLLFEFLTLKWLNYMHFLFWPSESPSYNYVHLKFLIFIESTYFSHMMITRGGAVQFSKTVVTLALSICNTVLQAQGYSS